MTKKSNLYSPQLVFRNPLDKSLPRLILFALGFHQFQLAGIFHVFTLLLVIVVAMITWGSFVPNAGPKQVLMHMPFAVPILIAAYCFLKSYPKN